MTPLIVKANGFDVNTTSLFPYRHIFNKRHRFIDSAFLENCTHKKEKKSIKNQRNCSNTFFKVFAKSVNVHSKI